MSRFRQLFNFREPDARGRTCVLVYLVVEGFLNNITTGIFYVKFLSVFGFSIVSTGILSAVPYIASMFVLLTPALLNRFPKRKWILAGCKLAYYLVNIGGLTLLVRFGPASANARLWCMMTITFFAQLFNVMATAGYAAWHIRFQPEEIRARFLMTTRFVTAFVTGALTLVSGLLVDRVVSMGNEKAGAVLIGLRLFALGLGLVDIVFLLLPREVDYPTLHTPRFSDIISVPTKNKKFMMTMLVVFLWQFSNYCYVTQLQHYLTETIGMSLFYFNLIVFLYGVFFIFCMTFWRRRINKTSWLFVYAVSLMIAAPFQILYGFISPANYVWLVLVVRLPQHFAGVGHNVAFENLQYVNMPLNNRECYTSFYQIVFNLGALAGYVFGTLFTARTQDLRFTLFGTEYLTGTPILVMLSGVIEMIIVIYILTCRRKLEPDKTVASA